MVYLGGMHDEVTFAKSGVYGQSSSGEDKRETKKRRVSKYFIYAEADEVYVAQPRGLEDYSVTISSPFRKHLERESRRIECSIGEAQKRAVYLLGCMVQSNCRKSDIHALS